LPKIKIEDSDLYIDEAKLSSKHNNTNAANELSSSSDLAIMADHSWLSDG